MELKEILSFILPAELHNYFEIVGIEKSNNSFVIYLEEKNISPQEYEGEKLESKGFYDPIMVQDFPLRGKACFLNVKRRRWTVLSSGKTVSRNWSLIAGGTRITQEFASFLKGINR